MTEWRAVHADNKPPREQQLKQKWQPPAEGWLKINSDGAVAKSGGRGELVRCLGMSMVPLEVACAIFSEALATQRCLRFLPASEDLNWHKN